ncbi:peptide chain release factor N(5)-glutamine methyltransferase [Aestuariibius sp. HNIBRBA575]|uniref:peptide chain release factor N(5)-glutamine methyltransferase n=1 Tax=Aestuariibius sp. HNIBRBA575 TaxID=3233343 RepID=UPI0034A27B25
MNVAPLRTGTQVLIPAIAQLRSAGVDDPARDARQLLAHALAIDPSRLTLALHDDVAADVLARFNALIEQRCRRVPVSHLIGRRLFYGRAFQVSSDVLDPRPETEELIARALVHPYQRVLDLGTGSGCILLTLLAERPGSTGIGVDVSEAALDVARQNAAQLNITAEFASGSWFSPVTGRFDLIVSNPPYIALDEMADLSPEVRLFEPRMALTDEQDGLLAYRAICADVMDYLTPAGRFMVEIGPTQAAQVSALMETAGFGEIRVTTDIDGRDRVVEGIKPV